MDANVRTYKTAGHYTEKYSIPPSEEFVELRTGGDTKYGRDVNRALDRPVAYDGEPFHRATGGWDERYRIYLSAWSVGLTLVEEMVGGNWRPVSVFNIFTVRGERHYREMTVPEPVTFRSDEEGRLFDRGMEMMAGVEEVLEWNGYSTLGGDCQDVARRYCLAAARLMAGTAVGWEVVNGTYERMLEAEQRVMEKYRWEARWSRRNGVAGRRKYQKKRGGYRAEA